VVAAGVGGLLLGRVVVQRLHPRHVRGLVLLVAAGGSLLAVVRGMA
jgi:hypothetical protein